MLKELYLLWLRLAAPQELHYINGADTLLSLIHISEPTRRS